MCQTLSNEKVKSLGMFNQEMVFWKCHLHKHWTCFYFWCLSKTFHINLICVWIIMRMWWYSLMEFLRDIYNDEIDCFVLAIRPRSPYQWWLSLVPIMVLPCVEDSNVCNYNGWKESQWFCVLSQPPENEWSALNTEYHRMKLSVTSFNEELYLIGGEDYWHNVQVSI